MCVIRICCGSYLLRSPIAPSQIIPSESSMMEKQLSLEIEVFEKASFCKRIIPPSSGLYTTVPLAFVRIHISPFLSSRIRDTLLKKGGDEGSKRLVNFFSLRLYTNTPWLSVPSHKFPRQSTCKAVIRAAPGRGLPSHWSFIFST